MKNPNGYGTVIKLKGNRRRPYVVRKTMGWDGDTRIIKSIGYYTTRDEAMLALAEYNKSPYDVDARKITMAELFERWLKRTKDNAHKAAGTINNIKSSYKHCSRLHDKPYCEIKAHMMQDCIDGCEGYAVKQKVKNLFHLLDKYALELDISSKNYSSILIVPTADPKVRSVFTDVEVARLWANVGEPWVDSVLIYLYTGWRFSELLNMRVSDVDLKNNTMRGGLKTEAGKNRVVPIHPAILPLVRARCERGNVYLLGNGNRPMSPTYYRVQWARAMKLIGAKHTIHETRHTFRTWLDLTDASISCINRIMGHTCGDVGLQTYTHKTLEELRAAVCAIKSEHNPNFDVCE